MKTYNTYQEAKIANPESGMVTDLFLITQSHITKVTTPGELALMGLRMMS